MPSKKLTKDEKRSRVLRGLGVSFFIGAIAMMVLMFLLMTPQIQLQIAHINDWFVRIELFIAEFDKLMAVAVILFFFLVKTFTGLIPFSVLFIGTGLVFSPLIAVVINAIGFGLMVSIKFLWGRRFGGGGLHRFLLKYDNLSRFMDFHGKGNKWMLVILRFVPVASAGTVSRAYGATDMRYTPFVLLSVLGFLPKLITWSIIGCNVYNPFTPAFMTPFIVIMIISGTSLLLLDVLFKLIRKDEKNEKE